MREAAGRSSPSRLSVVLQETGAASTCRSTLRSSRSYQNALQGDPETPYPNKIAQFGHTPDGETLLSSQEASLSFHPACGRLEKILLLGEGGALFSVCILVGGVSFERYLCPLLEEMNK